MVIEKPNTLGTIPCALNTLPNPLNQGINNPCVRLAPATFNNYSVGGENTGRAFSKVSGVTLSDNQGVTTNQ